MIETNSGFCTFGQTMVPLNTWEKIVNQIRASREEPDLEKKIDIIIAVLVNIRLLDKEDKLPDGRDLKENIETIYKKVLDETVLTLNTMQSPSNEYIYYSRELLKKLPIRSGGNDLIGDIRSAAEYFEEGRTGSDPMLSFAGDLRKEVHRKLSPRILSKYIAPYLEFIRNGNSEPLKAAGYMALASRFDPKSEDPKFIELAEEMDEKLTYLWDYETGDITVVKANLAKSLELFEKCFLRKEMETFLEISTPQYIHNTLNLVDCLKRLASFKMLLKKSYFEKRIELYDFLNLDLDIGRLVFIFTNDLTNNHYETVTFGNIKECVILVRELLGLLNQKGIIPEKNEKFLKDLGDIYAMESIDVLKTKRSMQNISIELQQFMQKNTFSRLGQMLNHVLEAYKVPTSSLSPMKDRFFNNFVRTTEFHAVNEFIEKIVIFLNRELAVKSAENSLYGKFKATELPAVNSNYDAFIATTWTPTPDSIRPFLGGKGNGIIDMHHLAINIPHAFILGLPICKEIFNENIDKQGFRAAIKRYLGQLEEKTGKKLGCPDNPLLVSVRSGTTISLPGSMCTILNVGLTPDILKPLAARNGAVFASNIYYRFLKNTLVALEISVKKEDAGGIEAAIGQAEKIVRKELGDEFLVDPFEQLVKCIELVFASSRSKTVREYLKELSIEVVYGTAVTIQQMVFGNKNGDSLSGVLFTRNPINGKDELFGEFKEMTQGEDVVMGNIITHTVAAIPPKIKAELIKYKNILERELKHDLDIEFTVEDGKLYLLQTRRASISNYAKLVVDTDMLKKGIINFDEFKKRLERLCTSNPFISVPRAEKEFLEWKPPISEGVPINHGIIWGTLVLTPEKLEEIKANRENIIFFAQNTKPSDFYIINNSHGIATVYPGRTSHAAITSITLNKPCIVGCSNAVIDLSQKTITFKGETDITLKEGELITLDANGGYIYRGTAPLSSSFIKTHNILDTIRKINSPAEAADEVERILHEKVAILEKETGFHKKVVTSAEKEKLVGRNVLVRLDLNVPLSKGKITDSTRIDAALPTIRYLIESGATPILCSHLGEPDKQEKKGKSREEIYSEYSLKPVAEYLRTVFNDLVFQENSIASSGVLIQKADIVKGKVNILENLRFAIGEKENDLVFARGLAGLSDGIFVNDAFGTSHRSHASITGVTRFVAMKLAGLLVEKELKYLGNAVSTPQRPFVGITGGSKISTKLGIIESLLQKIDLLIVGGGIGYTLLKATGFDVQKSLVEESMLETAKKLMDKYGDKIILPRDFVITDHFDFANQSVGNLERNVKTIKEGWESFDLGEESINHALEILEKAKTILWNGPIGAFEIKEGSVGTTRLALELAKMAEKGKIVIIGGGDSAAAVKTAGVAEKMTHVSTGGGASLEFLERLTLPGISVLDSE
ncbi:MAG TPA: phosphoglycerate kinase [Candidatus Ozemobacteraceae bacterium]|nr:phosphoglycerate kinase [Candidatus Ozemobacteraceae bacterium]